MAQSTPLEQLTAAIKSVLPTGLSQEVEAAMRAAMRASLERMDLVTREELEVQQAVLLRTREKLKQLEQTVEKLEQQLNKK